MSKMVSFAGKKLHLRAEFSLVSLNGQSHVRLVFKTVACVRDVSVLFFSAQCIN